MAVTPAPQSHHKLQNGGFTGISLHAAFWEPIFGAAPLRHAEKTLTAPVRRGSRSAIAALVAVATPVERQKLNRVIPQNAEFYVTCEKTFLRMRIRRTAAFQTH